MLKVDLNAEDGLPIIEANGTGEEILADCMYIVSTTYNELGPVDRIWFRELFTAAVKDPDSLVWEIRTSDGENGIKAVTFRFPDLPKKEDQNQGGETDD